MDIPIEIKEQICPKCGKYYYEFQPSDHYNYCPKCGTQMGEGVPIDEENEDGKDV